MNRNRYLCLFALGALLFATPLLAVETTPESTPKNSEWGLYGLMSDEQRFSLLRQINTNTVHHLGVAWSIVLDATARSLEATPLEINGILYFTTAQCVVYAVDAIAGKVRWVYDPKVWEHDPIKLQYQQGYNRGVAYDQGLIFLGASDGRLIALDSASGVERWVVNTVEAKNSRKTITGAPRVFNGKVIIGHGGADFGTRGYVTAYDQQTGTLVWRFYTVPGNPANGFEDETQAMSAKTWSGEWWRWGGGGTVWDAITFDKELDRIYLGVGNSSNSNPQQRSPGGGDNLFIASIVALDANTGKYVWHYQVNPGDSWDYDAANQMTLANLTIDGDLRKVLMQAPKNGFFYVIDRMTGKIISAEKFSKATWASKIDLTTGRPIEAPDIRYERSEPFTMWPSPWGAHNWQAMAFSPVTGLAYIPSDQLGAKYWITDEDRAFALSATIDKTELRFPLGASIMTVKADANDGKGSLIAWDPIAQRARWSVKYPYMWNGGILATAGNLVFQGTASGMFYAYDARNGRQLWKINVGHGIVAPPITYAISGKQYVSILAGYGGVVPPLGPMTDRGWRYGKHLPRLVTFTLDGSASIPRSPPDFSLHAVDDPKLVIDDAAARRGESTYNHSCLMCHGVAAASAGPIAPDLRESYIALNEGSFSDVLDGALKARGMPPFPAITPDQRSDVFQYIRKLAREVARSQSLPKH